MLSKAKDTLWGDSESNPDRCRKTISQEDLPEDMGAWCCYRETWNDSDHCFWHSERPGKTPREASTRDRGPLQTAKTDTVRLDKTSLRSAEFEFNEDSEPIPLAFDFSGHSLIGADLSHGDFTGCTFSDADIRNIEANDADFSQTSFSSANLSGADMNYANCELSSFHHAVANDLDAPGLRLVDANLFRARFDGAHLRHGTLKSARCKDTSLREANLENVNLERTEFKGADLTDARLYGADIRLTSIDETTKLGERCIYEKEADEEARCDSQFYRILPTKVGTAWRYYRQSPSSEDETSKLQKASRVYRMYQRLLRGNDLPRDVSKYRIRDREARRKLALQENMPLRWLNYSIQRWSMNYGESSGRVIALSVGVIVVCTFLFPLGGIQAGDTTIEYGSGNLLWTLGKSFYFSTVTFTTLGYGDLRPIGLSHLFSTLESFFGALLMALLVFVLGRRSTW